MTIYDILKCIVMNEELLDKHEADFFFGEEEQAHTHSHTWTGTINQKIAPFGYLDITDMDMWMLNECYYNGNSALTNLSNLKWDPNLGNVSFTSQGNYSHGSNPQSGTDGNGQLVFFVTAGDQKVNNENIYGNTDHVCGSNGDGVTVDNTCQLTLMAIPIAGHRVIMMRTIRRRQDN